jgi:hypothetical protein
MVLSYKDIYNHIINKTYMFFCILYSIFKYNIGIYMEKIKLGCVEPSPPCRPLGPGTAR